MNKEDLVEVAKIGKTYGLGGWQKLYRTTDFPEQIAIGRAFLSSKGETLTIQGYEPEKELVKFAGVNTPEKASRLTNQLLLTTQSATKTECILGEGEYFWFDVIGCEVVDGEAVLGSIKEIEEIGPTDFLVVHTTKRLVEQGYAKQFYIPYVDRYVIDVNIEAKKVFTQDALGLLENS